jgi:hypothetical protein
MQKYIIDPEIGDETIYFHLRLAHESGIIYELLTEVGSYVTHDCKGRESYPRYANDRDLELDEGALEWLYQQDKELYDYNKTEWDDWACAVWVKYHKEMIKNAREWLDDNGYGKGVIEFYYSQEETETKAHRWLKTKAQIEQGFEDMENESNE